MVSESANRQNFDLDSQEFLLPWILKKPPYIVLHLLLDVSTLVAKNMWCIIHPIQVFPDVSTPDTTTYIRFSTLKNDHRTCVDNKKCRGKTEVGGSASQNFLALFHQFSLFAMFFQIFPCMLLPLSHDTVFGYPNHRVCLHPTIFKKH